MEVRALERVRHRVARWIDSGVGTGWVVAVSGGSDSVGLLRVLHRIGPELGLRLSVAHLDHGVRAEAGRQDAGFVADLCERLGLPIDLGRWSPSRPGHFEADARRARYDWLAEVGQSRGASVVAVGHTRDDQAETILHRILRGTGPRGLAGIPTRRSLAEGITLVRPLLKLTREEIRGWLGELGQGYREDASNSDQSRTRARIRHDLLPRLTAEYNRNVAEALTRLGALAAASQRLLDREVERVACGVTIEATPRALRFHRAGLARLPRSLRAEVIRRAWRRAGWPEAEMDARRWSRLAALGHREPGRFSVGAGIDAWLDSEVLRLEPVALVSLREQIAPSVPVVLSVPGSVTWGDGQVVVTLDPGADCDERIDLDRIVGPLHVRSPRPGDRFEPLGMEGRSTPLNDFFRGRRLSPEERERVPLVCDQLGMIWVAGHRIADRVRVSSATGRTAGLKWTTGA